MIKDYCWYEYVDHNNYHSLQANDAELGSTIKMQWLIMGKYYDHIDRNTLNNRKNNLRPATSTENSQNRSKYKNNTSGFTGVIWDKKTNKWRAQIQHYKRNISIGYFENKEDAIRARLNAEKKYFGEFSPQKHLFKEYGIELDE